MLIGMTGSMNRALHPLPQRMTEQRCYRRSPVKCQGTGSMALFSASEFTAIRVAYDRT